MRIICILVLFIVAFTSFHTASADDSVSRDVAPPLSEGNWPSNIAKSWQEIDKSLSQMKHFAKKGDLKLLRKPARNVGIAVRAIQQKVYLEDTEKLSKMKHYLNKLTRGVANLSAAIQKEDADLISKELRNLEVIIEKVKKNHSPE